MPDPFYSPRRIQRIFSFLFICIVILVGTTNSCRRKADAVAPAVEIDTLAPKITNMHIPGIPPENIKIDQIKRQLIVTLPDGLTTGYSSNVSLTMTPGATLFRVSKVGIELCKGFFYDAGFFGVSADDLQYDSRELIIAEGQKRKVYRLRIEAAADMFFSSANKVYQLKSDGAGETFNDVVIHNYRDTSRSSMAIFRNVKTGDVYTLMYEQCILNDQYLPTSGFGKLPLGEYSMQIQKSNGRRTTNYLRMTLTAGKPDFYGFSHVVSKGTSGTMNGSSLYEGNFKAIEIWPNKTGEKYKVDVLTHTLTGTSVGVKFPANLPTGAYRSQLIYNNGQRSEIRSGYVFRTEIQPVLGVYLYNSQWLNVLFKTPDIPLEAGKIHRIWPSPAKDIVQGSGFVFCLQSVSDPSELYKIPITIPSNWQFIANPVFNEHFPSFVIPAIIKPGRYQFRIQYRDIKGVEQIGEWHEREALVE